MPNSNYRAGRDLEYEVGKDPDKCKQTWCDHPACNGYEILCRAAGSHGAADVLACKPGELLLIQCKTRGKDSPAKRERLIELAGWINAVPLIATWVPGGPRGGRTLAFRRLTGPASGDWADWTPDHALEATP